MSIFSDFQWNLEYPKVLDLLFYIKIKSRNVCSLLAVQIIFKNSSEFKIWIKKKMLVKYLQNHKMEFLILFYKLFII